MKMLVATNQDESTAVSFRLAELLRQEESFQVALLAQDATTHNFRHEWDKADFDLLVFLGHGKNDRLIDQNGEIILGLEHAILLQYTHILAFCCWTANELGASVGQLTTKSYWGFSGQLILHAYSDLDGQMSEILAYLYKILTNQNEVVDNLIKLKNLCDSLYETVLHNYSDYQDDYALIMSAQQAFDCIWKRLRVFANNQSYKHPEAGGDLLY